MVTKQYPHSISIVWNDRPTQNGNGGSLTKGAAHTFEGCCRAEPNGNGATFTSPDGTLINYSYTVYLPRDIRGSVVRATLDGGNAALNLLIGIGSATVEPDGGNAEPIPNGIEDVPVGASVALGIYGRVVLCKVKRFDRNFFNAKLWL